MKKDPVKYRRLVKQFIKEQVDRTKDFPIQIPDCAQNFSMWLDGKGYEITKESLNKSKKEFLEYYNKDIGFLYDDNNPWTAVNQGAKCCSDQHQTFYGAIIKSSQWQEWHKEQEKRFRKIKDRKFIKNNPVFDIDECEGIGVIGDQHLQEFFKFIKNKKE